jgi:hypothetical protein
VFLHDYWGGVVKRVEDFLQKNAVAVTALLGAVIVAGLIVTVVLVSGKSGELDDAKAELQQEQAAAVKLEAERDVAQRQADAVRSRKDQILSAAESQAKQILGSAKRERENAEEDLSNLESETASASASLEETKASLEGAEQEKNLSSFPAGIMKAEVDYLLGATYEASGGAGCYWALLNSANTNDLAGNEFTPNATQQIVTIETPYFTSEGCGTWERIE